MQHSLPVFSSQFLTPQWRPQSPQIHSLVAGGGGGGGGGQVLEVVGGGGGTGGPFKMEWK